MRRRVIIGLFLIALAVLGFGFFHMTRQDHKHSLEAFQNDRNVVIFIDLTTHKLDCIDADTMKIIKTYSIAGGTSKTPSPVGTFKVTFKAAWGEGFGTRFMGINVPWGKYGIHGTNKPNSIGWASSHGCIRMRNKDVEDLYRSVKIGTKVIIYGGPFGPFGSGLRVIEPGDRGADVYEVQRRMKEKGFYPSEPDGIYGEGMKKWVHEFQKKNKLYPSNNIEKEFYKKLGVQLFE